MDCKVTQIKLTIFSRSNITNSGKETQMRTFLKKTKKDFIKSVFVGAKWRRMVVRMAGQIIAEQFPLKIHPTSRKAQKNAWESPKHESHPKNISTKKSDFFTFPQILAVSKPRKN